MDVIIDKWKDISLGNMTSDGRAQDVSKILKEYIGKRFAPSPKENFLAFINQNTEFAFSEKKSYTALFSEIEEKIGWEKFFRILGIKDIEEAEMRSRLADVFYKAFDVITWRHQFLPLYERLTGEKIKIKRKVEVMITL